MPRYTRTCERCQTAFVTRGKYNHVRCIPCRTIVGARPCQDCGQEIPTGKRCKPCAAAVERARLAARDAKRAKHSERKAMRVVGCEGCGKPTPRGSSRRRHIHCETCKAFQDAWAKEAWRRPFPDVAKWEAFAARKAAQAAKKAAKEDRATKRPDACAHVTAWRRWVRREKAKADGRRRREEARAVRIAKRPWLAHPPGYERVKARLKLDPKFADEMRIFDRMRARLRVRSKDQSKRMRSALNSKRKVSFKTLGYTSADLRRHLERQFSKGMTWEAFRRGDIHIDHRVPLSAFDLDDHEQYCAAWALTNLQPLWASDNIAKGARRDLLL